MFHFNTQTMTRAKIRIRSWYILHHASGGRRLQHLTLILDAQAHTHTQTALPTPSSQPTYDCQTGHRVLLVTSSLLLTLLLAPLMLLFYRITLNSYKCCS